MVSFLVCNSIITAVYTLGGQLNSATSTHDQRASLLSPFWYCIALGAGAGVVLALALADDVDILMLTYIC